MRLVADVENNRTLIVDANNRIVGWQDFHGNLYDEHGNCEGHIDGGERRWW